jgi:hypothetical protein
VAGGDDEGPVGWYPPVPDLPAGSKRTAKGNPGSMNAKPTPEQAAAIEQWMADLIDMQNGTGKHEGHALSQVGRCVYCTCGSRYQGTLPKEGSS